MAVFFSVPAYIPDVTSGEVIAGYKVQSLAPVAGIPQSMGTWTDVNSGTPFTSNLNIFDPTGTVNTKYRIQPVRHVTVDSTQYTIDTPWSRPILPTDPVYDGVFTRGLMPTLRFTYLADQGIAQSNGTELQETIGAGNGLWVFDGTTKRFPLQYVMNDDPVKILENVYTMTYKLQDGTPVQKQANVDYWVDERSGWVEFATAPLASDYARIDFRRVDFLNQDLYIALCSAVNTLSTFGLNGYQVNGTQNLQSINIAIESPDLAEIICHTAIYVMREGLTELALRSAANWRDGSDASDPYPDRGLQFIVQKLSIGEDALKRKVGNYIRGTRGPIGYGEYDVFWNVTELSPLVSGMFGRLAPGYGWGAGLGVPFYGGWM